MTIEFISFSFFPLLLFCSYAFINTLAVDPGDYIFINLKSAKLNVKDLRALLDKRGLPYHDFHEKSEYVNALIESGPLTVGELKIARDSRSENISTDSTDESVNDYLSTTFSETAFSNSEIWLVRIEPENKSATNILEEAVWNRLKTTLRPFEVQFGRFNCSTAAEYCQTKGWNSPTLILVVPRLYNSTQHLTQAVMYLLKTSKNSQKQWVYEVDSVVRQIYSVLDGKLVRYLPSREDFGNLQTDKLKCSVHIVLLTDLRHCPFLLSALAAKFNYGSHCFAFGPKTIASGALIVPDNHVGAFYAVKFNHYYYSNCWRIIPQNQSTVGTIDGMSNAMITFESLSDLLQQLSPIEAEKPKPPKREPPKRGPPKKEPPKKESPKKGSPKKEPPKEAKKPSSPPVHTFMELWSLFKFARDFCWQLFGLAVASMYILFPVWIVICYYFGNGFFEAFERRGEQEELTRYRSNISSNYQSNRPSFRSDIREQEEEIRNEQFFTPRSATLYSSNISSDREYTLRSTHDIMTVFTLRFTHLTDWHKQVFNRYNFNHAVSEKMRRLLARYNIRIEEIGFPPYNWILRLPTVQIGQLSVDIRQSLCPICQYSIKNSDDSLCRLPCDCIHIVYHFDCIIPWLIKREDPSSHSFSSGTLHTERPCPTCRFDITTWGLRTAS